MLLATMGLANSTALAQQANSSLGTTVNVSTDDLLAQPVGANWTSYNGDYTGRRYSGLRALGGLCASGFPYLSLIRVDLWLYFFSGAPMPIFFRKGSIDCLRPRNFSIDTETSRESPC